MSHTTKIGAHVSIAGGIQNAPARAAQEKCETFQCFTRSPQGGPAPELTETLVTSFKEEMKKAGIERFYIHAPYYINLASLEPRIRHSSISVLRQELERGSLLGASHVMAHPGSYTNQTLDEATVKVQDAIARILDGYTGSCTFLIEISAGSGNVLGDTFEEVASMMQGIESHPGFGGICFDTCHAFASGYDFRTPAGARDVLRQFDKTIGLKWLRMSHVNDSKTDLGGKRDRHEHIGQGYIQKEGLASLLTTPEFRCIDWILETETEGRGKDVTTLQAIRAERR
jgi:deoxyribonuclease-4